MSPTSSNLNHSPTLELVLLVFAFVVHKLDSSSGDIATDDSLVAVIVHLFSKSGHSTADIQDQITFPEDAGRENFLDADPTLIPVEEFFNSELKHSGYPLYLVSQYFSSAY